MKALFSIKKNIALLAIATFVICSAFTATKVFRWEKLGVRVVNYQVDRDEIPVTLAEGTFNSLKLIVNRSPVNLHRFVIHFSNGGRQEVLIRKNIPKGGETRVIDLKGGNRGVKKVVFWYDTKNLARGRAVVELWGRH